METKTDRVAAAEQAMGIEADVRVELRGEYRHPSSRDGSCFHRHVAIDWEGGVLWLDMSQQSDHFCIDIRQFVPDPVRKNQSNHDVELAGQGVFTIVNGRRQVLAGVERKGDTQTYTYGPLADPDGTPVRGHGWNAGYVVTLMHDQAPSERQTNRPAGPGRG